MKLFQNLLLVVLASFLFSSCGNDSNANFTLKGKIKDLKKGVVYLQKDGKTSIVDLDSVVIKGQEEFTLQANIKEPVLLYLKLQKKDGQEHFIPFFADKGVTEITTTLKGFSGDAIIKGSKQQALLEEYLELRDGFQNKNLDLLKANFEAVKAQDSAKAEELYQQSDRLLKLKYASTINFALRNNDSEVAPYIAIYEIPNSNAKYLDSIYNNLSERVKQSYYGKKLGDALEAYKNKKDSIK
ncbi:DUF4369 domain-containing protein [Winogradskyella litorisediminis]|uniref:DUF4369 domain-containing protein n=1 Tax=Winogradskyella litorisediminis TaxID=1156618 RepID=A0ABW3N6T2_9FLAO